MPSFVAVMFREFHSILRVETGRAQSGSVTSQTRKLMPHNVHRSSLCQYLLLIRIEELGLQS